MIREGILHFWNKYLLHVAGDAFVLADGAGGSGSASRFFRADGSRMAAQAVFIVRSWIGLQGNMRVMAGDAR